MGPSSNSSSSEEEDNTQINNEEVKELNSNCSLLDEQRDEPDIISNIQDNTTISNFTNEQQSYSFQFHSLKLNLGELLSESLEELQITQLNENNSQQMHTDEVYDCLRDSSSFDYSVNSSQYEKFDSSNKIIYLPLFPQPVTSQLVEYNSEESSQFLPLNHSNSKLYINPIIIDEEALYPPPLDYNVKYPYDAWTYSDENNLAFAANEFSHLEEYNLNDTQQYNITTTDDLIDSYNVISSHPLTDINDLPNDEDDGNEFLLSSSSSEDDDHDTQLFFREKNNYNHRTITYLALFLADPYIRCKLNFPNLQMLPTDDNLHSFENYDFPSIFSSLKESLLHENYSQFTAASIRDNDEKENFRHMIKLLLDIKFKKSFLMSPSSSSLIIYEQLKTLSGYLLNYLKTTLFFDQDIWDFYRNSTRQLYYFLDTLEHLIFTTSELPPFCNVTDASSVDVFSTVEALNSPNVDFILHILKNDEPYNTTDDVLYNQKVAEDFFKSLPYIEDQTRAYRSLKTKYIIPLVEAYSIIREYLATEIINANTNEISSNTSTEPAQQETTKAQDTDYELPFNNYCDSCRIEALMRQRAEPPTLFEYFNKTSYGDYEPDRFQHHLDASSNESLDDSLNDSNQNENLNYTRRTYRQNLPIVISSDDDDMSVSDDS